MKGAGRLWPHSGKRTLGARGRSLLGVGIGVAALVALNGVVNETSVASYGGQFVGAPPLPAVQMGRPSAWRCPGPLPVGVGKERSRIAIVNSSGLPVGVTVTVSRTDRPAGGISGASSVTASHFRLDRHSQAVLTLSKTGPAGYAAVSVETDGGGVGVEESIRGMQSAAGAAAVSSPCSLGSAPRGYIPTGSTYGSSDVLVSLYDPDATSAVVDLSVSDGTTLTSPPAFQGVVVPADGLAVLDLRRWAFQLSSLAVTASAVSGDVVVGALETTKELVAVATASTGAHRVAHVHIIGTSLLVGPDRAIGQWAFTALQSRIGVASMFSVYDPGTRQVSVSVAPPGRSGIVAALTEDVPAGGIVEFATPIAPGTRLGANSVVVSAQGGTPIVVARLTTRERARTLEELNATSGTAGPRKIWLLAGAVVTRGIDDFVTLTDPGAQSASVILTELPDLPAVPVRFKTITLLAGTQRNVDLGPLMKDVPEFALEVSATTPILVEEQLRPRDGITAASGAIPVLP
ncbi:MAG: hypothetical protein ABSD85_00130 [Acidimicrobiales bacterium]|jgi:hypothetical protein